MFVLSASLPVDAQPSPSPLAIVGVGCMFPKAADLNAYWLNLREGVDAITSVPPTHWEPQDYFDPDPLSPDRTYAQRGGFLSPVEFDPLHFGISPNNLEATDTSQLLGMMVAQRAMQDAGYLDAKGAAARPFDRSRVSVLLGVTSTLELVIPLGARLGHPIWKRALREAGVDETRAQDVVQRISDAYVPWQENSFPGLLGNVVAGRIAHRLDLGGTNCVVDAACASSLGAIHLACLELAAGRSDMVITGGVDTFNDIFMYMCFSKTPALSASGNARPFDAAGDGTILGEGLGMLVIKRLADAQRDGDRVYALIRGVGSASDGKASAIYSPKVEGQVAAMNEAYRVAGVSPATVELVEAHGTGTRVGDATEATSMTQVFRPAGEGTWCALGAVKSQIGHTKAAAGVAGLIKAIMALYHKVLPPTIKVDQPVAPLSDEPGVSPFYLTATKRPWLARREHPRRAGVSAFGFGGSNFHCVLEEASAEKPGIDWDGRDEILAFSGQSRSDVEAALRQLPPKLDWGQLREIAAATRARFHADHPCRLLIAAAQDGAPESELIERAIKRLGQTSAVQAEPEGVYFGMGNAPGRLAVLFSGQGSQYPGMLRDLVCSFPAMQQALAAAQESFARGRSGRQQPDRLVDLIYPFAAFSDTRRQQQEQQLRATDVAQPALAALAVGGMRVLEHFGLRPQLVAGHSFGELPALWAAGAFDEATLHQLAQARGRAMAQATQANAGTMLAVQASLAVVEQVLEKGQLDLTIANINSPQQVVLSGRVSQIEKAATLLARQKIAATQLKVAAAFHSPLVQDASQQFAAALDEAKVAAPKLPVFANTTGRAYAGDPPKIRSQLARQLAQPVQFVQLIRNMNAAGAHTFVEVGPSGVLANLVRAILHDRDHVAVALDSSRGRRRNVSDLAQLLAQLAALGHKVDLIRWNADPALPFPTRADPGERRRMTVQICGANYVKERPNRPALPVQAAGGATPAPGVNGPAVAASPSTAGRDPQPALRLATNSAPARGISQQNFLVSGSSAIMIQERSHQRREAEPSAAVPASVQEAIRLTQQQLAALQQVQQQTAQLHQQFLQGQEAAQRSLQMLIEQQQLLIGSMLGLPVQGPQTLPTVAPLSSPAAPVTSVPTVQQQPASVAAVQTASPQAQVEAAAGPTGASRVAGRQGVTSERVQQALVEVVAQKTGYPAEMLEPGMSLDADLGIDSIKRVEILSALQEKLPEAPQVKPEHLGTLHTLADVVAFLSQGGSGADAVAGQSSGVSADRVQQALVEVVAQKTGYPAEMLEPGMSLDADLGIDSIKRVEILSALQEKLPEAPQVKPEHLGTLHTLADVVAFLSADAGSGSEPAPAQAAEQGTGGSAAGVQQALIEVVAQKTGYPAEMLELGMSLDADLGIDSIKRVEIFSALQEKLPHAPQVRPEHLGTLHTLADVIGFLSEGAATAPAPVSPAAPAVVASAAASAVPLVPADQPVQRSVVRVVELAAACDVAKLGMPARANVVVGAAAGDRVAAALVARLDQQEHRTQLFNLADAGRASLPDHVDALIVLWPEAELEDAAADEFLLQAFTLMQRVGPLLREAGQKGKAVLLMASRVNGAFGFGTRGEIQSPISGGLAGMVKTAGHEWPEVTCRAVDLASELEPATAGELLAEELLASGPVEVGLWQQRRVGLELIDAEVDTSQVHVPLTAGDVVVVTGGARGVTAEVAVGLAQQYRAQLVLLGRSELPVDEPAWLAELDDAAQIKAALIAHATNGDRSPKAVERRYQAVVAARQIRLTLDRIAAAGAKVTYLQADVRDAVQVRHVLKRVQQQLGPVRGLVHGAGVLADRLIADKTRAQFEEVYKTKIEGLRHVWSAIDPVKLRLLVLFSSTTARLGRKGQVDYAVANEVLNKFAQQQARVLSSCRVVSVNWGPWDGGMVNASLKQLFAAEGVGVIGLQAGVQYMLDEISQSHTPRLPVETVVLGKLEGNAPQIERVPSAAASAASAPAAAPAATRPAADESPLQLAFERLVSAETCPILRSHVINGNAVIPVALAVEWMAAGAMHANPGLAFAGFENLQVLKGIVLEPGQSLNVQVLAGPMEPESAEYRVPVELASSQGGRRVIHLRTRIVLCDQLDDDGGPDRLSVPDATCQLEMDRVYGELLFHGPQLQAISRVTSAAAAGLQADLQSAPAPANWLTQPLRSSWVVQPMALDGVLQLALLARFLHDDRGSLPAQISSFRQYCRSFPAQQVRATLLVREHGTNQSQMDAELFDQAGNLLARVTGCVCVADASLNRAFRRNRMATQGILR